MDIDLGHPMIKRITYTPKRESIGKYPTPKPPKPMQYFREDHSTYVKWIWLR